MPLETKYLETALQVAKLLNFSKAAEELSYTQPTVSRQIKIVEEDLGVKLFERSNRSNDVELTEDGRRLMPLLELIVGDITALTNAVSTVHAKRQRTYTIGVGKGLFSFRLQSKTLAEMYITLPDLNVRLVAVSALDYEQRLRDGELDAVLLDRVGREDTEYDPLGAGTPEIRYTVLKKQPPCIGMPADHPLAQKSAVSITELKDEKFVFSSSSKKTGLTRSGVHEAFLEACDRENVFPQTVFLRLEGEGAADMRSTAVRSSKMMFPTYLCEYARDNNGIRYVPLSDTQHYAEYFFACRADGEADINERVCTFFRERIY